MTASIAAITGMETSAPMGPNSPAPTMTAPNATAGWIATVRAVIRGASR